MTNLLARFDEAFERLVIAAAGNPRALLLLAEQARNRNHKDRALEIAIQARDAATDAPEMRAWAKDFIADAIPEFHWPMLRDIPRNHAFQAALARAVTPETRILDVGSGTGLLAMMAARLGARQVVSCEANPAIAEVAQQIVASNGFGDRVTVLARHSSQVDAEADLGGVVDVVVSEIIGKDVVDECVVPAMLDVARRLLKPGGQMIPRRADVRVALAWWDGLKERAVGTVCGFDVSPLNRLHHSRFSLARDRQDMFIRGADASLFSFDLAATEASPERATIGLEALGGPVNGVVQWIGLEMDEHATFENRPDPEERSSWGVQFFPLRKPITPAPGEVIEITGSHFGNTLRLWES